MNTIEADAVFAGIVGQHEATQRLTAAAVQPVHAYLFVGPAGSGKRQAARAFAALLIGNASAASAPSAAGAAGGAADSSRNTRLALAGDHPDVREVARVGASITKPQAMEIVQAASLAPIEGNRKVLILDEFHLVAPEAAAVLLKTIEEPPPSTVFLVLADQVPPELVTIASRCVRIDFRPLGDDVVEAALTAEGIAPAVAAAAAQAASGDLDRARLLAADKGLADRRAAFANVPTEMDGTGSKVVSIVANLLERIEAAAEPLKQRQAGELAELEERVKANGERGSGRKGLEDRHKRESRRHRADELRSGLAVMAATYRDALVAGGAHHPPALIEAVDEIHRAIETIDRNPNEPLLLQALLLELPTL